MKSLNATFSPFKTTIDRHCSQSSAWNLLLESEPSSSAFVTLEASVECHCTVDSEESFEFEF